MVTHARLGGADGMRLHRAAFAVMIKYSKSTIQFEQFMDEIDIMDSELPEDKTDRAIELRKHLSEQPDWANMLK